jgi:hypothetical protein
MLKADRLKRMWIVDLTAPSHARVVIIHRSNGRTHAIRFVGSELCQMLQPAEFWDRSSAAPSAESGAPSTPTLWHGARVGQG